jgi:thioredoxin-related protein
MKTVFFLLTCFLVVGELGATRVRAATEPKPNSPAEIDRPVEWNANFAEALVQAEREHKLVLLDFTGSDWCYWCQRLHAEVLSQPSFALYARNNLVLVVLDYPRRKSLEPELAKQNAQLADQFSVNAYPTIILVDSAGKELGRTGYMQGGPKTFVRELKRLVASRESAGKSSP